MAQHYTRVPGGGDRRPFEPGPSTPHSNVDGTVLAVIDPRVPSDDVLSFLAERHLATLTTLRVDGSPHVVAVGFTYRRVVDGQAGEPSLAEIWRDGFALAPQNWGSDFIAGMTQSYHDPFVRWSALYNFGLEAISRAAITALATQDADLARRTLAGNIVFDGSWGSLVLGVMDGAAPMPTVVPA